MTVWVVTGGVNPGHPNRTRDAEVVAVLLARLGPGRLDLATLSVGVPSGTRHLMILTSLEGAPWELLSRLVDFARRPENSLWLVHEALVFDRRHVPFKALAGARFLRHPPFGRFAVGVNQHPWTAGLPESFFVEDECYEYDEPFELPSGARGLLEAGTGAALAWEYTHPGGGRVVYSGLGHDIPSLAQNPHWCRFMGNVATGLWGGPP